MSPCENSPVELRDASSPKIAIKGFSIKSKSYTKPASLAAKATSKHSQYSTLGKRPRAALQDGSEDEDEPVVRYEAVTGFDSEEGGATKKNEAVADGPLVIPRIKNRDWREEIRQSRQRGKNLLPPEVQAQRSGEGRAGTTSREGAASGDAEVQWGLTVTKKSATTEQNGNKRAHYTQEDGKSESETMTEIISERPREKTADELALKALLGSESPKKFSDLIIPTVANGDRGYARSITEDDSYRRAVRSAPDVSTPEDYERVPVEEFGAALLRGMGWKEGDEKKETIARPKDVKRRQNLLGLGATELKGAEELGAWVQKSDPKRLVAGRPRGGEERRPRANEYREREDRKRESRDERYGSHRRNR